MKKTCLISLIILGLATVLLSSCGSSDSVYYEDWFETNGYVETEATYANERTGQTTTKSTFIAGDHPEGVSIAVRHEHRYSKSLSCTFRVKTIQTDLENDIIEELREDTSKTKRFTIPTNSTFEKIDGFIFYCDDEYVYVVNNLYKYGYRDHTNKYTNPQYRFEVSISGLPRLTIDMDHVGNVLPY